MTWTVKLILILFGLAYLISPVDIIPDLLLPGVGWLDDSLVLWCIYYLIRYGELPWFFFKRPNRPGPMGGRPAGPGKKAPNPSARRKTNPNPTAGNKSADKGPAGKSDSGTGRVPPKKERGQAKKQSRHRDAGITSDQDSPYQILGVDPSASWEEIQTAYKEKAKQYHPDKLSHLGEEFSSLANEKFLKIQAAYTRLKAQSKQS